MPEDTQLTAIFPELERYFSQANVPMRVAESHGLLCARFCVQGMPNLEAWIEEIFGPINESDASMEDCFRLLLSIYKQTSEAFGDSAGGLDLLLPDDSSPLSERSRALSEWCNGFVVGLGLSGLQLNESAEPEVKEVLSDLLEFSQMEDRLDESEENELAYMEIVEYIRVAVISLGLSLRHREPSETLH